MGRAGMIRNVGCMIPLEEYCCCYAASVGIGAFGGLASFNRPRGMEHSQVVLLPCLYLSGTYIEYPLCGLTFGCAYLGVFALLEYALDDVEGIADTYEPLVHRP